MTTAEITRADALRAAGESPYPGMCERYERCSVNQCPLDHLRARMRGPVNGDAERTCKAPLRARLEVAGIARLGSQELPWGGMTREEAESGRTHADLIAEDEAQAALRSENGRNMRLVLQMRKFGAGGEAVGATTGHET